MIDAQGNVIEYVGNARDVTERRFAAEHIQSMAMTDELTGLANRNRFMTVAPNEFNRSRRHGYDLSLLIVDVDDLATINDSGDRLLGDRALQIVAEACKEACRADDSAARLGGDEFAVLLSERDRAEALDAGERLRTQIDRDFADGGLPLGFRLTVSVGVATARPDDREFDELLRRAEIALQRAERKGRNWTCE